MFALHCVLPYGARRPTTRLPDPPEETLAVRCRRAREVLGQRDTRRPVPGEWAKRAAAAVRRGPCWIVVGHGDARRPVCVEEWRVGARERDPAKDPLNVERRLTACALVLPKKSWVGVNKRTIVTGSGYTHIRRRSSNTQSGRTRGA